MRFSDYFDLVRGTQEDWFDAVLSIDTPLFIDPFLIYGEKRGRFRGSHATIIAFFNSVFRWVAAAQGRWSSVRYRKAVAALLFPEVEELCLGYTAGGTKGSGSGRDSARVIAAAIWEAIQAGVNAITHFEEIAILREGIGADRISDAVATLLRKQFAAYTSDVCERHGLPTEAFRYPHGVFNVKAERWERLEVRLPRNPYNGKPVLLVPERYLNVLPTINPDDFWDYCYTNENEILRNEFSYDVTRNVSKAEIIALARRRADLRERYLRDIEARGARPYDVHRDAKGLVRWYDASGAYCQGHPLALRVGSSKEFLGVVSTMVDAYRHFIQENEGWRLLWNDNRTSKGEKASQLLFLGIVKHYCQANDIDISPEPNVGRGPVDFKVSRGYQLRLLLEVKLARNTRFWNGLTRQLPTYLKAEGVRDGYFLVIAYDDRDLERLKDIQGVVGDVNAATGCRIRVRTIDAGPDKPSASKL